MDFIRCEAIRAQYDMILVSGINYLIDISIE
jgi:hypothetical protein